MTPASTTSRLCAALLLGFCPVDEAAATSSCGVLAPPGIAPAIDLSPRTYEFRDNLAALPVDERSVVLRTLLTWEHNRDYRYNAQPLHNYRRWLAHASVRTIHDVVRLDRVAADARGFFEVRELPDLALLRRRELRRRKVEAAAAATAAAP